MVRYGASRASKEDKFQRELAGLILLCEHFGIRETDPVALYLSLALALARRHVPYFMEPKYKKPATLQAILPALDAALQDKHPKYLREDVFNAFRQFSPETPEGEEPRLLRKVSTETFERELKRWRKGEKEKE